jgi:hypothetical protein
MTASGGISYRICSGKQLLELCDAGKLRVWEFNRALDEARVARMTEEQLARIQRGQSVSLFMPTPVTVCRLGEGLLLMDGQHRLAVLRRLAQNPGYDAGSVELLLCEAACSRAEELEETFVRVNSGTPVPASYYNRRVLAVLDEFIAELVVKFPKAVSKAARPQRPNFNGARARDEMATQIPLRDAIIDGKLTAAALMAVALEDNALEKAITSTTTRKLPESALNRAAKTDFYLGLREGWAAATALRAAAQATTPEPAQ